MNYKNITWILITAFTLLLVVNKWYYTNHPNQVSFSPYQLSLMKEADHSVHFIDRNNAKGIVTQMYGSYTKEILQHTDWYLSTSSAAEFTLPHVQHNGEAYLLREHPALRYKLWQTAQPDIILLGSSIFFSDFDRTAFFKKYPEKKLLDFTTGNNTPYISAYMLQYAFEQGLRMKPNTVVLYGMNRVEMFAGYKDSNTHDFLKKEISEAKHDVTAGEEIAHYLKLPEAQYTVTHFIQENYNRLFRSGEVYKQSLKKGMTDNEFAHYQQSIAVKSDIDMQFDNTRVAALKEIAHLLQKQNCSLTILKLPQSLYNDIKLNTVGESYFDIELQNIASGNISYVDVSDYKLYNINHTDYIWPGNIFDPEHLNIGGATRFTNALMKNIVDSLLTKQNLTY